MNTLNRIAAAITAFLMIAASAAAADFNVKDYGAKGNGKQMNTDAFNKAVVACSNAGGGRVIVPAGVWLTGTVMMQDNVELHLEDGALVKGADSIGEYVGYVAQKEGFEKYKMAYAEYWNKALVLAVGKKNVSITGPGCLSGEHVINPEGEDRSRGPHTIVFAECTNFTLREFTVIKAGNYAFMGYELKNGVFENLKMREGFDGIHVRGGRNIIIRNCLFETGDDAIAGGYWNNFVISDCHVNSTCNGIRIIYPATDLEICDCLFKGPGVYPHRSVKSLQGKKLMMAAVNIQPGAWQATHGPLQNIHIHDITVDSLRCVFHSDLKTSTWCEDLVIERVKATQIYDAALQIHSWKGGTYDEVQLRDIDVQYVGRTDKTAMEAVVKPPLIEAAVLPYWALYARNIRNLVLENVNFTYTGSECRGAIGFDNIADIKMSEVNVMEVEGKDTIDPVNCALTPQSMVKKFIPTR
jgi:hypothetical protein